MKTLISVLALALVTGGPALSADQDGKFAIKGAGLQTCSAFNTAFDEQNDDLGIYYGWVDGFVTGLNQFRDETFDAAPWQTTETLLGLMREVCRAQSEDPRVIDVVNRLIGDFTPLRLTRESRLQGVKTGERSMVIYQEVMKRAEQVLDARDFDPGLVDGVYDQATADAITAFQEANGLSVTGLPNQQTLFALFVRNSGAGESAGSE